MPNKEESLNASKFTSNKPPIKFVENQTLKLITNIRKLKSKDESPGINTNNYF